jgi:hypothetical protein
MIKIQGPVSANLWVVDGKKIWVFGDQHHVSEDCGNAKHVYLEDLVDSAAAAAKSPSEKIEVFVERGRTVKEDEGEVKSYMARLNKHFYKCYSSECSIKLHAADRRHDDQLLNDLTDMTLQIRSHFFDYKVNSYTEMDAFLRQNIKFDTTPFVTGLKKLPSKIKTVRDYLLYLLEDLKINKQLSKIENEALRKKIDKFFSVDKPTAISGFKGSGYQKFLEIRISDLIRDLTNHGKSVVKQTKKKSNTPNVLTLFVLGFSDRCDIFMDKYLIGRMFGKSVGNKVVISVGFVHADTYNKLFREIGGKHLFSSEAKRDQPTFHQCLKMKKNLF